MKPELKRRAAPQQDRAQKTIDLILKVTAELLDEIGFERLSTNLICQKADLTPPALYRYFPNKYSILCELGQRLMDHQNTILRPHFERMLQEDDPTDAIYHSLQEQLEITEQTPGGRWILRALHATPALCDVRTQSHDFVAGELTKAMSPRFPDNRREAVQQTMRLNVEIGYSVTEYLLDVPEADRKTVLRETAELLIRNFMRHAHSSDMAFEATT